MSNAFEIIMIVLFGLSWPNNVLKTWRSKSTRGKSLLFLVLIWSGYAFGIAGKLLSANAKWYVLFFYILNFSMVSADLYLYMHYRRMEARQAVEARAG